MNCPECNSDSVRRLGDFDYCLDCDWSELPVVDGGGQTDRSGNTQTQIDTMAEHLEGKTGGPALSPVAIEVVRRIRYSCDNDKEWFFREIMFNGATGEIYYLTGVSVPDDHVELTTLGYLYHVWELERFVVLILGPNGFQGFPNGFKYGQLGPPQDGLD